MACFFVKCGAVSDKMSSIHNDERSNKSGKIQTDDVVVGKAAVVNNERRHRRRVGNKERKTIPSNVRRQGGGDVLGGWLAAWLEEAGDYREKDEVKMLKEAGKG